MAKGRVSESSPNSRKATEKWKTNKPRSGRPTEIDDDQLKQLIDDDPSLSLEELAETLGCGASTVRRHLLKIGKARNK